MSPTDVVEKQLTYYNNRDLDGFMSVFSNDIKAYDLKSNDLIFDGITELKERYKSRFDSSPNLHSKLLDRLEIGNIVIDNEYITGFGGDETAKIVAIYQVDEDKISKMWFVRET